jgi:prophage regulatory protein
VSSNSIPLPTNADSPSILLRLPQVRRVCGLSTATIYRGVKAGTFPQPRKLGTRVVAWTWGDIRKWLEALAPHVASSP